MEIYVLIQESKPIISYEPKPPIKDNDLTLLKEYAELLFTVNFEANSLFLIKSKRLDKMIGLLASLEKEGKSAKVSRECLLASFNPIGMTQALLKYAHVWENNPEIDFSIISRGANYDEAFNAIASCCANLSIPTKSRVSHLGHAA